MWHHLLPHLGHLVLTLCGRGQGHGPSHEFRVLDKWAGDHFVGVVIPTSDVAAFLRAWPNAIPADRFHAHRARLPRTQQAALAEFAGQVEDAERAYRSGGAVFVLIPD